jgi:ornithine carbamoyltransferase
MPHFLDIGATPAQALRSMLDVSRAMKDARVGLPKGTPDPDRPLKGRMLAMIFEKPSTRTRVSFDMAMRQLGGETMLLNGAEMQIGRGETLSDTGKVLSRYVDAIMIRTTAHDKLLELAGSATVPVINALTDDSHPCQIMADMMTIEEHRGPIAGKRLAWTGDGNNMAQTFIEAAARFDFDLALACPEALDVKPRFMDWARSEGARVSVTRDPAAAVAGADAVITDTWLSMGDQGAARERRHNLLRPYQVDAALMAKAKPDALFLHCLPAHRGEEATAEVMDGPQSVIFDEAENRLHAQKGILRWCMGAL